MRRSTVAMLAILMAAPALAQAPAAPKSLASTLSVYVFPNKGQAAEQQSKDEAECYQWAVQNTGSDPFDLQKQAQQQAQQTAQAKEATKGASRGAGAAGAVGGAAAGALIGEIASNDAGKGAAYGAAAGAIVARHRGKAAEKEAAQNIEAQGQKAQQATAEQITNFKKAFSVCLEAKDYMVKF